MHYHQLALRTIGMAGCSDQLDLCNLGCMEHLLREPQLVEYFYANVEKDKAEKERQQAKKGTASGPSGEEMELFRGAYKSSGSSMVCPELTEWIGRQLERDANIMKQARKAREERAAGK